MGQAAISSFLFFVRQSLGIDHGAGSGVLLPGGRILTVAHLTADQTFVQIQRSSTPDKQRARQYCCIVNYGS